MTEKQIFDKWEYVGDIDPYYGGKWIKIDEYLYAEIVEVVDLDSATGADGLLLVSRRTVPSLTEKKHIKGALSSRGMTMADLRGMGKENILILLADALHSYGYSDPVSDYRYPAEFVIVTSQYNGNKSNWDSWDKMLDKAESIKLHKEYNDDLTTYIETEWLD